MLLLAYLLGFCAALFLLVAALAWLRVARSSRDPVSAFLVRAAAWLTSVAFGFLGLALIVAVVDWAAQKRMQMWDSASTNATDLDDR